MGLFRFFLIFQAVTVTFLAADTCSRRRNLVAAGPLFDLFTGKVLPSDVQVSVYLEKNKPKTFVYSSQIGSGDDAGLSATLITCQSKIEWSLRASSSNSSTQIINTIDMDTFHVENVAKGLYYLEMAAVENASYVHVYMSSEFGGPQTLQQKPASSHFRVTKGQKRKRLTVKWNPSLVDPQCTDYCLVISTARHYKTLCSAQSLEPHGIVCVGRKTHYTFTNSAPGLMYYLDLFATNNQSNFTYPYGTTNFKYDVNNVKSTALKDGKATFVNLKKFDGKAVFRYKVGQRRLGGSLMLDLYIMPCGGVVDVEITLKNKIVVAPQRVEGFRKIQIQRPVVGGRYHIKIFGTNREEMKKSSGVEIYATTKPKKIPLPSMPSELQIREYSSMTTCESVTVGWMVAAVQKTVTYCVIAKEGTIREAGDHSKMPNQCGLENRLRKSADYAIKYCSDVKYDKEKVVLQQISQLKPGRNYIIQVTVKKPRGKTLSYDLLQVSTKPSCKYL